MRLDTSERLPRLFFTEAGLVELRAMVANRRLADPKRFAHVRQELGIDPVSATNRPRSDEATRRNLVGGARSGSSVGPLSSSMGRLALNLPNWPISRNCGASR